MRLFLGTVASCMLLAAAPGDAAPARKTHGKTLAGPANGVKTPGVQVPFARLKPDATIETSAKPEWLAFVSNALYLPGSGKIDRIDPKTNKFEDSIAGVKEPCGGVVSAFGSLWTESCGDGALLKVDPKAGKISATLIRGAADITGSLASSDDSIWMLLDTKTTLARIDPDQMMIVGAMRLPESCRSLISAEKSLWIACADENKVYRINPDTNLIDKRIDVSADPVALAFGEGSVWALCRKDGKLERIDPKTNKVSKTIDLGVPGAAGQIAVGEGSVWVTMTGFPITRIDPKDESVAQQFWGGAGGAIALSPGAVWLSNLSSGAVSRIDPNLIKATLSE